MTNQLTLNLQEENEKLQMFLFEMDDLQEAFLDKAAGYKLDYSLPSLAELERYLADKNITFAESSDQAVSQRLNCWTYLGELFRKNFGGGWSVSLDEKNSINYGQFVIEKFDNTGVEFEPLGTLRRYLRQSKPGNLRTMIEAHVRFVPTNLSRLADPEAQD